MLYKPNTTDPLQLIYCDVGSETLALDMSWVRTIQRLDGLLTDPEMEIDEVGFIGWLPSNQGDVPVFNLASRLGRSPQSNGTTAQQRIIVLPSPAPFTNGRSDEGQPWGLLVDRVSPVARLPADRFESLPPIVIDPNTNYYEGVIKREDTLTLLLSPEWLHPNPPPETNRADVTGVRAQKQAPATVQPSQRSGRTTGPAQLMLFSTDQSSENGHQLTFGLSINQVPEVLTPLPLVPIPTAPPFVLGLVKWRDQIVPVIDLAVRLGLSSTLLPAVTEKSRLMIVLGSKPNSFGGFLVQSDVRLLRLPVSYRPATRPVAMKQNLIKGAFELDRETLVIPDIKHLLQPEY